MCVGTLNEFSLHIERTTRCRSPSAFPPTGTTSPATCPSLRRRTCTPGTKEPITADDLAPLFAKGLIEQELSTETDIEIPEPVRDAYRNYRTTPLIRAHSFEKASARRPTSTSSTRA